ncbi:hypothetical protein [Sphingomonas sp. CV7422]|uniref:hypothetical protein n=1 Tax=Sphingomonas sp. CV7422 TaxID=3018036 RepID=UPI0022FEBE2B|nr:hypothetical protein [Sphingomonas sp. CV7422]
MSRRSVWLILLLAAVALRLPDIGNPLIDVDEQMYLLVGERMWAGALPYVDIWDRKPIGLFLIAAAANGVGEPWVTYHLLALAAAAATAGIIAGFARRHAGPAGALAAGLLYLVWIALLGGRGGQSPVFYNLLIAGAAWLVAETIAGRRRGGAAAMLLVGLALQIKPTVVFEGVYFALALLAVRWRREPWHASLRAALLYGGAALLPTVVAATVYVAAGHGEAWWFANVESILLRRPTPGDAIALRMLGVIVVLLVPAGLAIAGLVRRKQGFLIGWVAAAVIGWLLVPPYFNHYALPLLLPFAVAAAAVLDRPAMRWLAALAGAALLLLSGYPHLGETRAARDAVAGLAARIEALRRRTPGCLFVVEAPPVLYSASRSCLPTRYPFPFHLVEASEAGAIGTDPTAEVARILATRPPVIAVGDIARNRRRPTVILVRRALAARYRRVTSNTGVDLFELAN